MKICPKCLLICEDTDARCPRCHYDLTKVVLLPEEVRRKKRKKSIQLFIIAAIAIFLILLLTLIIPNPVFNLPDWMTTRVSQNQQSGEIIKEYINLQL